MAEKEERTKDIIYVFSQELICKDCKDWYEHIDPLDKQDCDNCEDIADLPHISRQEAIERMAKAICRRENLLDSCSHCMFYYKKQNGEMCKEILTKREDDMEPSYIDISEAALDALLDK